MKVVFGGSILSVPTLKLERNKSTCFISVLPYVFGFYVFFHLFTACLSPFLGFVLMFLPSRFAVSWQASPTMTQLVHPVPCGYGICLGTDTQYSGHTKFLYSTNMAWYGICPVSGGMARYKKPCLLECTFCIVLGVHQALTHCTW